MGLLGRLQYVRQSVTPPSKEHMNQEEEMTYQVHEANLATGGRQRGGAVAIGGGRVAVDGHDGVGAAGLHVQLVAAAPPVLHAPAYHLRQHCTIRFSSLQGPIDTCGLKRARNWCDPNLTCTRPIAVSTSTYKVFYWRSLALQHQELVRIIAGGFMDCCRASR